MSDYRLRPAHEADRPRLRALIAERWGAPEMIVHGQVFFPAEQPALLAESGGELVGLATYRLDGADCELLSLDSLREGIGIGAALLAGVEEQARLSGCTRLFLVTTNDNLRALGFYQRRGYRLRALRPGAVDAARALKPQIPEVGENGIPLRDELELEKWL